MKKEPVVMQVYPLLVGEIFVVFLVRIGVPIYSLLPQSTLTHIVKITTPHCLVDTSTCMHESES
jgi:hypothetical protein